MAVTMVMACVPYKAFAAVTANSETSSISAVQELHQGNNNLTVFTFTNRNTTSPKKVLGTKVRFEGQFRKAPGDQGIGNVVLTLRLKDTNGNFITGEYKVTASGTGFTSFKTPDWNIGYYGREICLWSDASSAGASNGHYRSIQFTNLRAIVE